MWWLVKVLLLTIWVINVLEIWGREKWFKLQRTGLCKFCNQGVKGRFVLFCGYIMDIPHHVMKESMLRNLVIDAERRWPGMMMLMSIMRQESRIQEWGMRLVMLMSAVFHTSVLL